MQDLASILYQKGETDRAYKYIQSSLEDANFIMQGSEIYK